MRNFRTPYFLIVFLLSFNFVKSQHYLSSPVYNQNFNTIGASAGVHDMSTLPAGWSFKETGSFINNFYRADNASMNLADTYSYGADGSAERAFGSMASSATNTKFGITFVNTTGETITALTINYTAEQWWAGAFNRNDTTLFHYQVGNSLWYGNNWVNVPQLNIITRPPSGMFQLNGNDPMKQQKFEVVIENISIPVNDTFSLRWSDIDIASGNDDGVAIDDFTLTAHSEDIFSPRIINLNPSAGATVTGTTLNGEIHFSEAVKKGTGNIRLTRYPGTEEIQSININDASVVISGQQLTFSFPNLEKEKDYQVLIDSGAIQDLSDNNFPGLKAGQWVFAVASDMDAQQPLIDTLFPKTGISTNYVSFRLYFEEPVKKGNGKVYVKNSNNNQTVIEYSIDSSAVKISGNQLSFKSDYLETGGYYVTIDSGAVKDMANNNFKGISKGQWSFSISGIFGIPPDNHPITINTKTPSHGAVNVNPTKLEIYWFEYVLEQYGYINIRRHFDDSLIQQIHVTSSAVSSNSNYSSIAINPLPNGVYYVEIEPGTFTNIPGTEFVGTNKTNWYFTVGPNVITAVDDIDATKQQLTLYGNPVSHRILAKLNELLRGKALVEVFNNVGMQVTQKNIGSNGLIDIDVKGWTKGMYILKTTYGNKTVSTKVMVQ